jgi:hypothetical protein
MDALLQYIPPHEGLLPKWLLLVSKHLLSASYCRADTSTPGLYHLRWQQHPSLRLPLGHPARLLRLRTSPHL